MIIPVKATNIVRKPPNELISFSPFVPIVTKFLAKSYLELEHSKPDVLDFLYFDSFVYYKSKEEYENNIPNQADLQTVLS